MTRRRTAEERLQRLLVMLPWLMERSSVPIAEVAHHFDLTEREVTEYLELASMCGLPPYVDELIDLYIDEGVVYMGVPRLFTRPLTLTSVEALELLIAVRAALALPGADPHGPLARGLRKLAVALGQPDLGDDRLAIEIDPPGSVDDLVAAARRAEVVELLYWSPARETPGARRVVPRQVFTDRGNWYLAAVDAESAAVRTFRLDRIVEYTMTADYVDPPDVELPTPGTWFADDAVPRVTIRLPASREWQIERYPLDEVRRSDAGDVLEVVMPVTGEHWLARLMVRLGPGASVVEPAAWQHLGAEAADRILARYRT